MTADVMTLWLYAQRNDASEVERMLVDALVPVDDANDLGETALHLAASRGHDDVVRVLLQHNANLMAKDWVRCLCLPCAATRLVYVRDGGTH